MFQKCLKMQMIIEKESFSASPSSVHSIVYYSLSPSARHWLTVEITVHN